MFRYRLHDPAGGDIGEATYAQMIHVGDEIIANGTQNYRVVDVVMFDKKDEAQFIGLLQVEAA